VTFERPPKTVVPELLFDDDCCLIANCGAKAGSWFMHTARPETRDVQAYRKLIRLCPRHRFRPEEPLPGGMRELSKEAVQELWEDYGRFNGTLQVARAQGFMVVPRDSGGADRILRANWTKECGRVGTTPVMVCERQVGGDSWTVEWVPAVQSATLATPAGDSRQAIQEHARFLYGELSAKRAWTSGRIDMGADGFRTPAIDGFDSACQFALLVLDVENTLRDPEQLMVSLVSNT